MENINQDSLNCFRYFWTWKAVNDLQYAKETEEIKKRMSSAFSKYILAWSTKSYPSPDFLVQALCFRDKNVKFKHSWTRLENGNITWSGSVAKFKDWPVLRDAARYAVRNLEDIRIVWFPDIVNVLVVAERSHPLFSEGFSRVIITGRRSMDICEEYLFQKKLKKFGEVLKVNFLTEKTQFGKIAEVDYRFATHAFVAKFLIDGMEYDDLGFLHAEIEETEKEQDIRKNVIAQLTEHFKTS